MARHKKKRQKKYGVGSTLIVAVAIVGWTLAAPLRYKHLEWETTCMGEGRVYRALSTNVNYFQSSRPNARRALRLLGKDGKSRYYTKLYQYRSLVRDDVWRFQYNPKDTRYFGIKDQAAVLHGDEQSFEFARNLDQLLLVRKAAPPLRLPCVMKKLPERYRR